MVSSADRPNPRLIRTPADYSAALTALRNVANLSIRDVARALRQKSEQAVPPSTLGGWFAGKHLPTTRLSPVVPLLLRICGEFDVTEVQEWMAALERVRRLPGPRPSDNVIPFRGLASYEPEHADFFFGRDMLTRELVELVAERQRPNNPVIVVGPSGSGKSSVLRAGLIPRLAEDGRYRLLTPGNSPLDTLARQLASIMGRPAEQIARELSKDARVAARTLRVDVPRRQDSEVPGGDLLIVVDQFEEAFTLCSDEHERCAFIEGLCSIAEYDIDQPSVLVVFGMRADFYGEALRFPALRPILQQAQFLVGPMTEPELREAITGPAEKAKLTIELDLVEVLLRDIAPVGEYRTAGAAHEAGALPLLSHALLATCTQARSRKLTVEQYRATGGIEHAVSQSAEEAFTNLKPAQQEIARWMFLRLVHTENDTTTTRRRARADELLSGKDAAAAGDLREVLDQFIDARLISVDDGMVQITHEALLSRWERLRTWVSRDEVGHRIHRRLTSAATDWQDNDRDPDLVLRGGLLQLIREWADDLDHRNQLNALETEYLDTSLTHELDQRRSTRQRIRRRYQLLAVIITLVLVATGVTSYARQLQITGEHDRTNAEHNNTQALSRLVADEANRLLDRDVPLGMQLALAAYRIAPTAEARSSLVDATDVTAATRLRASSGVTLAATVSSDGALLAAGTTTGTLQLWNVSDTGRYTLAGPALTGLRGATTALAFDADRHVLAAGGQDRLVHLWNVTNPAAPRKLGILTGPGDTITSVAISPNGKTIVAGSTDNKAYIWNISDHGQRAPVATLTGWQQEVSSVAFTPDGQTLAVGNYDGSVSLWNVSNPTHPGEVSVLRGPTRRRSRIFSIAISHDGHHLAAGVSAQHAAFLWDISSPNHPTSLGPPLTGPASWVNTVSFSPDDATLAVGSSDSELWLFDLRTQRAIAQFPHPDPVTGAAFRNARSIVTVADDGTIRSWNLPGPVLTGATDSVFAVTFDAAGDRLGIGPGSNDNTLTVWDPRDLPRPVKVGATLVNGPRNDRFSGSGALTPNGRTFVVGDVKGAIQLWDISDPPHPTRIGTVKAAQQLIESVTIDAAGRLLAVSADDGTVRLFDISNPKHLVSLATLSAPSPGNIYGAAFNPDSTVLAAAGDSGHVYVWNIRQQTQPQLLATLGGFTSAAYSVAFNHDGRLLAAGSADNTTQLWNVTRPDQPQTLGRPLTGPVGYVYSLAFEPHRDVLATGSTDHTIWLWDLNRPNQPKHLATLTGPTQAVLTVAFSPDGHTLAAGGHDHTVRLWNTDTTAAANWICDIAGEPITPTEWKKYIPGHAYDPPCR